MPRKRQWLKCKKCGKVDKSTLSHVGTDVIMRCEDCAVAGDSHAKLCRDCCPTGHGTDFTKLMDKEDQ